MGGMAKLLGKIDPVSGLVNNILGIGRTTNPAPVAPVAPAPVNGPTVTPLDLNSPDPAAARIAQQLRRRGRSTSGILSADESVEESLGT